MGRVVLVPMLTNLAAWRRGRDQVGSDVYSIGTDFSLALDAISGTASRGSSWGKATTCDDEPSMDGWSSDLCQISQLAIGWHMALLSEPKAYFYGRIERFAKQHGLRSLTARFPQH